jgi:exonuclease SbcC
MFLNKVKFTNFCQHTDREIVFGKGLNVIVGPNGSGKSNIMNGVYAALTGDFTRNAGKASDNISINKLEGRASQIELSFSHGSKEMSILRRLEPAERQFIIDGSTYTADKEVSEKLSNILEVDKDILSSYVFVEQWDNFGPLSLSPAKRIAAFQKLFKIDQLNKISEELSEGSVKLSAVSLVGCDVSELQARFQDMTVKVDNLNTAVEQAPTLKSLDAELANANKHINDWKAKTKLSVSLTSRKKTLEDLKAAEGSLAEKKQQLNASLVEAADVLDAMEANNTAASKAESEWIKYDYYIKQKQTLETKLTGLQKEREAKAEPIKPAGYTESDEDVQKQLDDFKFKLERNNQFLSSVDKDSDSAECPVCGTPAKNLVDRLEQAASEISILSSKVMSLTEQISRNRTYDNSKRAYDVWMQDNGKRIDETVSAIQSLNVETKPEFSREEASQVLENYKTFHKALVDISKGIDRLDVEIGKNQSAITGLESEIEKETTEFESYQHLTEETVTAAETAIVQIKADREAVSSLVTDLAVAKAELKAINEKIESANKQVKLAELHGSWNERVDNLRKIFKYNALPMVVSYKYMDRVVVELNKTLSSIGVQFNIELEPDLSFTANFGSHKVPAARLSGGQKVILTIAYRLAVNFTFATNLGLLCLDEPTVGLDDANLNSLERAFERLREFSMSNGVQIVVVTHEKGIGHLFDHTIDLSKV